MRKDEDTLLRQITENNRQSTVFIETGYTIKLPFGFNEGYTEILDYAELASGFFVESDKIVTTIDVLAGAIKVAAIPANHLGQTVTNNARVASRDYRPDIWVEIGVSIEGVTAFDAKNNLVLLKVADVGVPLPLEDSDTVQIGEEVYALGYENYNDYKGISGTFQNRYRNGKWCQLKIDFFPGLGGAPVLNKKNKVIGVIAYANGSLLPDKNATMATAMFSSVLKELLSNSGKVMPLEQWQRHARVRAYALEAQADEKADLLDNSSAIKDYNAAFKLNPDLVEIYSKRGILKARLGDFRGALRDLDKIIQINPEHVFAYNNRASVKVNLGDEHGAFEDLNKAIEINPEYIMAYINLAGVKMYVAEIKTNEGDIVAAQQCYQEAIDYYAKALTLNPKNPGLRKSLRLAERKSRLSNPSRKQP